MTIGELIKEIEVLRIVGDTAKEIADIQFDSRRVGEGSLFVSGYSSRWTHIHRTMCSQRCSGSRAGERGIYQR